MNLASTENVVSSLTLLYGYISEERTWMDLEQV